MKPVPVSGKIPSRFYSCIALGVLTLGLRAALLPVWPIPQPSIYDEFSYLLQADTFAHGRLTNPPHPMWQFFESIYILQQPTYASRYPPGQSLFMAAGQALFGHPWFGVWLSCGLLAAALFWALQTWVRGLWLLAGAAIILQLCFFSYWMNSYWGGAVAAMGGAIVVGAWARLLRCPSARLGFALGAGSVIVIYTRPFEGLLLLVPIFAHLAIRCRERKRVWIPVALCGAVGAAWLGFYHYRVTGSPLRLPYREYFAQYETVPPFNVLPLGRSDKITFRHFDLEWLDRGYALELWQKTRTLELVPLRLRNWFDNLRLLLGSPWWTIPLLGFAPFLWRSGRSRFLCVLAMVMFAASFTEVAVFPHYAAPFTAVFIVLTVQAVRYFGPLSPWFAGLVLALMFSHDAAMIAGQRTPDRYKAKNSARPVLEERLARAGGRHAILVHYTKAENPHVEWIYNGADIDGAQVVWAQDMGDEQNKKLIAYFPDRKFWRLEPDEPGAELAPYP